jgi:dolichyl-diphosphooligosaccharide--protein glycosyltransferase
MTVPYSTTGYDEWGTDDGYTNVSVRANTSYRFAAASQGENGTFYTWSGSADVTEGQVIGENDSVTTVEMQRSEIDIEGQPNESGNETTGGNGDSAAGGGDEATGNETAGSLVPQADG